MSQPEPAKLAPEFIEMPRTSLSDLRLGESGWVNWLEMEIDHQYRCFINPQAKVYRGPSRSGIQVTRTEAGFEVMVPTDCGLDWKLGRYDPAQNPTYQPVVNVSYGKLPK